MNVNKKSPTETGLEIAVIGMSCRFPGAVDIDTFWDNLVNGVESIYFLSDEELEEEGIPERMKNHPAFVRAAGGLLQGKGNFDPAFFNYTPVEANILDPQVRILHECAWEALEHSGYAPSSYAKPIGLYVGCSESFTWQAAVMLSGIAESSGVGEFEQSLLSSRDYAASRVAYRLNLSGPALTLHTACSTSLVAVHLACRAILTGDCHMALAGGVSVSNAGHSGYMYQEGMVMSDDGHCRAFSADSNGSITGEGAGLVVLKRLKDARTDRDYIWAVIKGSAINNDGNRKVGYTAPSIEGQRQVIERALHLSGVAPESVSYVETHGTGTPLGDPVEIEALTLAFGSPKNGFCRIGSLKTNVGHMNSAAGVGSLIKTILALHHRLMPPSLNFERPNPRIDFQNSPFRVNDKLREWKQDGGLRRAGVSSFGIGGTNAHIILEEAPLRRESPSSRDKIPYLLTFSAATARGLDTLTEKMAEFLETHPDIRLADAAYTLQVGRENLPHRRVVLCSNRDEAARGLRNQNSGKRRSAEVTVSSPSVVFIFYGLGHQYPGMGRELYDTIPSFRWDMDECFAMIEPHLGDTVKKTLFAGDDNADLHNPQIAQCAVFAIEYSLARLLMRMGIEARAMIGYSFGEYVAACVAGVFSLEEAFRIIVSRSRLVERVEAGAMISVPLAAGEVEKMLGPQLSLAIDNGVSCVVAGSEQGITEFEARLKGCRVMGMRLNAPRAIHSFMMNSIREEFEGCVGTAALSVPQIPYISNVTGQWIGKHEAVDPGYWGRHLCGTVRFAAGIHRLIQLPDVLFIGIGPGSDVAAMIGRLGEDRDGGLPVFNVLRNQARKITDYLYFLNTIGGLWLHGLTLDWDAIHQERPAGRIPLPTYPFQKHEFWLDGNLNKWKRKLLGNAAQKANRRFEDYFYSAGWKHAPVGATGAGEFTGPCLLFAGRDELSEELRRHLLKLGFEVVVVRSGSRFNREEDGTFTLHEANADDYAALVAELESEGLMPRRIVHLWCLDGAGVRDFTVDAFKHAQTKGFFSLLFMARALAGTAGSSVCRLDIITANVQDVDGTEEIEPWHATVSGIARVLPQEIPSINCRIIDIKRGQWTMERLWEELCDSTNHRLVALRGRHRWIESFDNISMTHYSAHRSPLKKGGVYLLTGGLGGIGLEFAQYLIREYGAKLILTGRSPQAEREETVRSLIRLGGDALYIAADCADFQQMELAVAKGERAFGPVDGVFHLAGLVTGDSFQTVDRLSRRQVELQLGGKAEGLIVLNQLFRNRSLDFCFIMSSIASVLGGLKFAAYTAANAFLDAGVRAVNLANSSRTSSCWWLSVGWDGMGIREAGQAIELILKTPAVHRIVISTAADLESRRQRWEKLASLQEAVEPIEEDSAKVSAGIERPQLLNEYVPPDNDLESTISRVWGQILGFSSIGAEDDFLELGGDSLKAVSVVALLQKKLRVPLTVVDVLESSTPRRLAVRVRGGEAQAGPEPLPFSEKKDHYLLSSAQQRLFVLQWMNPQGIAYNQFQIIPLRGDWQRETLMPAFQRIIQRHEALRTSFALLGETAVQKIHETVQFQVEDLSDSYHQDEPDSLQSMVARFVRPHQLDTPPLFRVGLIKLQQERSLLLLDIHHIITDGVSFGIFKDEMSRLLAGEALEPVAYQYRDYSEWTKRSGFDEGLREHENYWLREFAGEIPVLEMPVDFSRPAVQSFEGDSVPFYLDSDVATALKQLAREFDMTLFMLFSALFALFLGKMSNQEDVVMGTPTTGRNHPDSGSIMGVFINMLALRLFPVAGKSFAGFLRETRARAVQALAHAVYPYEDLVQTLDVKRDMSRNALFDVMFDWQSFESAADQRPAGGADLPQTTRQTVAKYDLTLQAYEAGDRITCVFEYCTALFERRTVERFVSYFSRVVQQVAADNDVLLKDVFVMSVEERRRVAKICNDTSAPYPDSTTIPQLLSSRAQKDGSAVALEYFDGPGGEGEVKRISYGDLERMVGCLAHHLGQKGVRPGMVVAVLLRRSVQLMAAIFAVLKAGAVYLPVNPEYPRQRVDYMLRDSDAALLLTNSRWAEDMKDAAGGEVILCLDTFDFHATGDPDPSAYTPDSHDAAYIIYTSGSTGRPKGALIEHHSVLNRIHWMQRAYPLTEGCALLQKTSIGFDVSVWELFWWSLAGASLGLLPPGAQGDPTVIARCVKQFAVTHIHFVPSMMRAFLEYMAAHGDLSALASLQVVFSSGEVLPVTLGELFNRTLGEANGTRLANLYGPTEATVDVSYFDVPCHEQLDRIPIGKPIDNIRLYIVDRELRLVPPGVAGELLIAGVGLARGYVNRQELTDRSFVCLRDEAAGLDERVYRTGDLARRLADGDIEYLGRIDQQIKIRGFRIEPEEIRRCLLGYGRIRDAVALAVKQGGDVALHAYVVAGSPIEIAEVKSYLTGKLPDYMIPARFVLVDEIPLTANGKVDVKALEKIGAPMDSDSNYAAPESDTEMFLVEVWQRILHQPRVGVHDVFFDIGGDSLKLIRLFGFLQEKFPGIVEVRDLFDHRTVRSLGRVLENRLHPTTEEKKSRKRRIEF